MNAVKPIHVTNRISIYALKKIYIIIHIGMPIFRWALVGMGEISVSMVGYGV